jgi:hypothetical protein
MPSPLSRAQRGLRAIENFHSAETAGAVEDVDEGVALVIGRVPDLTQEEPVWLVVGRMLGWLLAHTATLLPP